MRRLVKFVSLLALTLMLGGMFAGTSHAATPAAPTPAGQPPTGIAISPVVQDRVLGRQEKNATFVVELTNHTDKAITFALSSQDFTALNQAGGLQFVGSDISRVTNGNGLSGILKLDVKVITLAPKSSRKITAKIDDVSKLAVGGHYAAILAQALPDGNPVTGNRVAINQVVSALIFLETAGQGTKQLKLLEPKVSTVSFSLPREVNLVFKAGGNTQMIPRGLVTLEKGNKEIGRGIINVNSSLLLPNSTRLFQIPVTGNKNPWLPGTFKLRVQYRYEGSFGVSTYEKTFFYVNIPALLIAISLFASLTYAVIRNRKRLVLLAKRSQPATNMVKKRLIVVKDASPAGQVVRVVKRIKKQ